MADKISMSQRALGKGTNQRHILSQRYISNNVTLKKRTVCILRPVPAFGWAPVTQSSLLARGEKWNVRLCVFSFKAENYCNEKKLKTSLEFRILTRFVITFVISTPFFCNESIFGPCTRVVLFSLRMLHKSCSDFRQRSLLYWMKKIDQDTGVVFFFILVHETHDNFNVIFILYSYVCTDLCQWIKLFFTWINRLQTGLF